MRHVVRAVVELVGAVSAALSQHHRVGEGGGSRGDMHGGASGKVEAAHPVGPSARVPGPAGDGVVDNRGPDEHEDDAGEDPAALGDSSGGEGNGDGREHALVDGEEDVGDARGADRRGGQHVLEAEVGEVADEGAGVVGEGEGVAPEEPLEGRYGGGHDREPDQ